MLGDKIKDALDFLGHEQESYYHEALEELKQLKEYALLGTAFDLAIQKGETFAFCDFEYTGLMRLDHSDKKRLLDWHQQQLEKEVSDEI